MLYEGNSTLCWHKPGRSGMRLHIKLEGHLLCLLVPVKRMLFKQWLLVLNMPKVSNNDVSLCANNSCRVFLFIHVMETSFAYY